MTTRDLAPPAVRAFGERAFTIELGDAVDVEVNARVHALAERLDARRDALRIDRVVPAYASLLVRFDPSRMDIESLRDELLEMAADVPLSAPGEGQLLQVPVRYGGQDGPDLEEVAARTGLSVEAVIAAHCGTTYRVFMLGFAPGFAYLGILPVALQLPRRAEPRLRVPAGSVAIAAAQTAVYPHSTAAGWHLLGRTETVLWDGSADPPSRLRPGDRVRFMPA